MGLWSGEWRWWVDLSRGVWVEEHARWLFRSKLRFRKAGRHTFRKGEEREGKEAGSERTRKNVRIWERKVEWTGWSRWKGLWSLSLCFFLSSKRELSPGQCLGTVSESVTGGTRQHNILMCQWSGGLLRQHFVGSAMLMCLRMCAICLSNSVGIISTFCKGSHQNIKDEPICPIYMFIKRQSSSLLLQGMTLTPELLLLLEINGKVKACISILIV